MFNFFKKSTPLVTINTMLEYEQENKNLRKENWELTKKLSNWQSEQYDLKQKIERLERFNSKIDISPATTHQQFAELIKIVFGKAISTITNSFEAEVKLKVYDFAMNDSAEYKFEISQL